MDSLIGASGFFLTVASALLWAAVLLAPWRPWSTRQRLEPMASRVDHPVENSADHDLPDITVIIPARNEAKDIGQTLRALAQQGPGLEVIVVDDQSTDGTDCEARAVAAPQLTILAGEPLPAGWSGKLWALEQGRARVRTPLTLLLDADIALAPGILVAARAKLKHERLDLVSLMATPRMESSLEKLAMPAFVYFFKLLYPFRLSNSRHSSVAAAAGGFVLVRTRLVNEIGAFASLKDELIDDCALARRVKRAGGGIWLGLSRAVQSQRCNRNLADLWRMISRTAFTQLRYSRLRLGLCTAVMGVAFCVPVLAPASGDPATRLAAMVALAVMVCTYIPVLNYYKRAPVFALTLPLTALLYLVMTWGSAVGYWRGRRGCWKGRVYREGMT